MEEINICPVCRFPVGTTFVMDGGVHDGEFVHQRCGAKEAKRYRDDEYRKTPWADWDQWSQPYPGMPTSPTTTHKGE